MVLLAVAGVAVKLWSLPNDDLDVVEAGRLDVSAGAVGSWDLDPIEVVIDQDSGIAITESDRVMWASPFEQAFLTAGRGEVDWTEFRGYFWGATGYDNRLGDQSIEKVALDDETLTITGVLSGDGADAAYEMTLSPRPDGGVRLEVETEDEDDVTSLGLISGRSDGAGVHGLGEQFTDFDLDGSLIPIVVREQGVGRGGQPLSVLANLTNNGAAGDETTTYAAWSSFVTDDLRGLRLDPDDPDSHAFAVADTRDPDQVGLEVWAPRLSAELTSGDTPVDLIAEQQSGPRAELATWADDGAIVGLQGGTDVVRQKVQRLREAGAEISAVWLQDWTGQRTTSFGDRLWWTWQLDEERYPGWADLVDELSDEGIRTTTYINPWMVDAEAKDTPGLRNLWAEARDAGYLVTTAEGDPYELDQGGFDATLVDLTNTEARTWFATVIAESLLADGVEGFMADFGEGLPFDAVTADGKAATLHNRWPALWAKTVREGCELASQPGCVTWFRSGSLGMSEDAALFWNGDQMVDLGREDGLESALLGSFSAGVSGWPLTHSDLGGYTSVNAVVRNYVRDEHLLARWEEFAAFGVVFRTHEGNRPDVNRQVYDADETATFTRMSRLFAALGDYRSEVIDEAEETGVPALRHPWLVVPGTAAAEVDTEFFLGDSILVAPVLTGGADKVEVSFPPGQWKHLITGKVYDGDVVANVAAPIGTPAAFVRVDDPWADRLSASVAAALSP